MILFLCFVPLIVIIVIMKFVLLVEESAREINHVKQESKKPHEYLANVYEDLESEDDWD